MLQESFQDEYSLLSCLFWVRRRAGDPPDSYEQARGEQPGGEVCSRCQNGETDRTRGEVSESTQGDFLEEMTLKLKKD